MKRTRRAVVVATMALVLNVFPLVAPAHATHSCGFEPCPHADEVVDYLCYKFPVLSKPLNGALCYWT